MNPLRRYPVLASLLRPSRRSQQKTCAALVSALCQCAQASSFAIAGQLACLTDVRLGSALNRLYRFLRNPRFDNWLLTEQMLRLLGGRPGPLLLTLD
jgi:acyl-CoA thioesterase